MSWFHDDTKVYVNVITNKLTNADATPIKNSAISATVRGASMTDNVLAGMVNGLGARARRYWKYGDSGKFIDGLPTVTLGVNNNYPQSSWPQEPVDFPGSFYPNINVRKDRVWLTKESDEARYLSSRKTLKRLGLNVKNIVDEIEQTERTNEDGSPAEGENPSENLDDVFFLLGLDIYTQHPESCEHMYDFLELLDQHSPMSEADHFTAKEEYVSPPTGVDPPGVPNNAIFFSEREDEFEIIINYDYIWFTGPLTGIVINPVTDRPGGKSVINKVQPETLYSSGGGDEGDPHTYVDPSTVSYYKQLTRIDWGDASDTYGVYAISGVVHETHVKAYGETNFVFRTIGDQPNDGGQPSGTYDKYHGLVVGDPNYGRSGMYFPICKETLELRHTIQEEEVIVDAMMLIMHAAEEVELEWYQQRWFKIVMAIIIAALIYYGLGDIALEAMSFTETLTVLATQVGISFLVDLIVKYIPGELGIILGAAAAYYAASKGNFGSINAFMPQAENLLIAVKTVGTTYEAKLKNDVAHLNDEIGEYKELIEDREDQIREAYEMMGGNQQDFNFLDVLLDDISGSAPSTDPSSYYEMAKSTKNMADIVKSSAHEYHSRMKMLPEVNHKDPQYV